MLQLLLLTLLVLNCAFSSASDNMFYLVPKKTTQCSYANINDGNYMYVEVMVKKGNNFTTHFYVDAPNTENPKPIDQIINSLKGQYDEEPQTEPQTYYLDFSADVKGTYGLCFENTADEDLYVVLSLSTNGGYDDDYYYERERYGRYGYNGGNGDDDAFYDDDVNMKHNEYSHLDAYNIENLEYSVNSLENDVDDMVGDINTYWNLTIDHSTTFETRKSEIKKLSLIAMATYVIAAGINILVITRWLSKTNLPIN